MQSSNKPNPAPAFGSLTASRDAETIRNVIMSRYGFEPTLEYCAALIDFVEALTDGQPTLLTPVAQPC